MAGYIGSKASVTQVDGYTKSEADARYVEGDDTLYVDQTNNRVGIGASSPSSALHVKDGAGANIGIQSTAGSHWRLGDGVGSSNGTFVIYDYTNSAARLSIINSGKIGINEGSPSHTLHVNSGATNIVGKFESTDSVAGIALVDNAGSAEIAAVGNDLAFYPAGSEKMRLTSAGDLLVGQSSTALPGAGNTTTGISVSGQYDAIFVSRSSASGLVVNRNSDDGDVVQFRKDGTTVGSIGTAFGYMYTGTGDVGLSFRDSLDSINPFNPSSNSNRDNAIDLGHSSTRFDDIYATNGSIQTSDRNEKQDIAELTDAEQRVAVAAKGLLRKFRWKSAGAEKSDEARTHFGIIAQDLQAAFAAEGLDAGDYAMFVSSTWTDEETGEERTRLGVRYSELLAFIIGVL